MLGFYFRYNTLTELSDLKKVQIYRPDNAGSTWKGMSHSNTVKQILNILTGKDLECRGLRFCLSRNNADMALAINVLLPEQPNIKTMFSHKPITMFPSFGLITSNARRLKLTFYCGVSDTKGQAAFVGHRWFASKRHTTKFSSEKEIETAIDIWTNTYPDVIDSINRLRLFVMSRKQVDRVLINANEKHLISWARIRQVTKLVSETTTPRGKTCNAWDLMVQFSRLVPMNRPIFQMNQLYEFGQMLLNMNEGSNPRGMGRPKRPKRIKQELPK